MSRDPYIRFQLTHPEHVGEAHSAASELEIERLGWALDAGDDGQAIGYLKCLVEAVAKVVLDLNGTPAGGNDSFDTVVNLAHKLLAGQPGHELIHDTPFGNLATQARKTLPRIEAKHARAIGVAVGQRAATGTFNVRIEGVDAAVDDPDLERWPAAYRVGVATGLLFGPDELPTLTARNLHQALQVCEPTREASDDVVSLIHRVMESTAPGLLPGENSDNQKLIRFAELATSRRPQAEQQAWAEVATHVRGE